MSPSIASPRTKGSPASHRLVEPGVDLGSFDLLDEQKRDAHLAASARRKFPRTSCDSSGGMFSMASTHIAALNAASNASSCRPIRSNRTSACFCLAWSSIPADWSAPTTLRPVASTMPT